MWTLDASIYVRAAEPDDPSGATCQELIDRLSQTGALVIVPRLLLAELAGVVRRLTRDPIRARLAIDSLSFMPHVQLVTLDDALIDEAAEIAADRALKGADAVYVAGARRHRSILVTLDREQRERAAALVAVMTPTAALSALAQPGE